MGWRTTNHTPLLIAGLLFVGGCESARTPTAVDSPPPQVPASPTPQASAGQGTMRISLQHELIPVGGQTLLSVTLTDSTGTIIDNASAVVDLDTTALVVDHITVDNIAGNGQPSREKQWHWILRGRRSGRSTIHVSQGTRFQGVLDLDVFSTDTASSPLKVASFRVVRYPVDRDRVRDAPLLELHDVTADSARVLGIRFDIGGQSTGWCLITLPPPALGVPYAEGVPYAPGEQAYLFGVNDRDPYRDDPVLFFSTADKARDDASALVVVQDRAGTLTALTASTHIEVLSAKPVLPPPRAPFWFAGDTCGR